MYNRILLSILFAAALDAAAFVQPERVPLPNLEGAASDVRAVALAPGDQLYAATASGVWFMLEGNWQRLESVTTGPTYDLWWSDAEQAMYAAGWDGLYVVRDGEARKISAVEGAVAALGPGAGESVLALGPEGSWRGRGGNWQEIETRWSRNVRAVAVDTQGNEWIATGMGLYRVRDEDLRLYIGDETELYSAETEDVLIDDRGRVWVASWGGLDVLEHGVNTGRWNWTNGLPFHHIKGIASAGEDLWLATTRGLLQFSQGQFTVRNSQRWLPSDDTRDVCIGADGTVWVATANGVSCIRHRTMTLKEKSDYYQQVLEQRHVREPGLVEKIRFESAANLDEWRPIDDDNDGEYTSLYLGMECLRYAETKNPAAKQNADRAFSALEFLQTVTGTEGFFARTVVPKDWPDPVHDGNETFTPEMRIERLIRDPRAKVVETRWRESADGKWLWKGDTSSDETVGHFFGYYMYYEFAAETEAEKTRVRRHVARVMDYIIDGGYVLRDIDGEHTRWGVWSPEKLWNDPEWRVERNINALEILSFLKASHHITGDDKYDREYRRLIDEHGYAELCRRPRLYGISERTHIDDCLIFYIMPALLRLETDPELLSIYREGYTWVHEATEHEMNPMHSFMYGWLTGGDIRLEECLFFLRDTPLDLRHYTIDNSQRDDVRTVRRPMLEPLQVDRMLPPSERGVMRWDKNPWEIISGDFSDPEGLTESSGVFWLMPYWLGRHAGYITE